eukprot:4199073-Pleurochrysis_carterae.AAC.1
MSPSTRVRSRYAVGLPPTCGTSAPRCRAGVYFASTHGDHTVKVFWCTSWQARTPPRRSPFLKEQRR